MQDYTWRHKPKKYESKPFKNRDTGGLIMLGVCIVMGLVLICVILITSY